MPEVVDLAQQLRLHLESLQASGVLLVPRPPDVPLQLAVQRVAAPEAPPDPFEVRRHELELLASEVAKCDKCNELFSTRTQTVFGTGPLDAEVAFVGAAPGAAEDAQGEPFAGKGGQVLSRIINACGWTRASVYLFNAIKCRTPKSRPPTTEECVNCRDFFGRQFELVKPKHVVALGEFASRLLTRQKGTIGELRNKVHEYRGVPLICMHHPDDIEKDTTGRLTRETGFDLKLLLTTVGRDAPK